MEVPDVVVIDDSSAAAAADGLGGGVKKGGVEKCDVVDVGVVEKEPEGCAKVVAVDEVDEKTTDLNSEVDDSRSPDTCSSESKEEQRASRDTVEKADSRAS